jgi:tetratricopeptide (TPR) repeat protein
MEEDLIRRYYTNELSPSERIEVELRQQEDSEFASMMINFQETRDGIRLARKQELKDRLRALESEKKPRKFMLVAVAAALVMLIGVGAVVALLLNEGTVDADALYAEYYEPYPNVYAPITRDVEAKSDLEKAFAHYEQGDYEKALSGFEEELKVTDNPDVLFYKAIALIQLGKSDDARNVLSSIQFEESSYQPQILWYEALLLIQKEELTEAKSKLTTLDELKSGYKTLKVRELLEKL